MQCSHTITNYKSPLLVSHRHKRFSKVQFATVLTSATGDRWRQQFSVVMATENRLGRTSATATSDGNGRSYRQVYSACDGRPTLDGGVAERAGDARRPARR